MQTPLRFNSRRSPVFGVRGMVAASQPLAVAAGLEILSQGGSAADAAVATAAALNVTEPTSTGIGGDCFALYYEASTQQVTALNGSGRAPAGLTLERLRREGYLRNLQQTSCLLTTPIPSPFPEPPQAGADLVERHGRLP
jgi:gamma-glutamyltranspeptidase / glutathione hydrolase